MLHPKLDVSLNELSASPHAPSAIEVAGDPTQPGWFYIVKASDDDIESLDQIPGATVDQDRMLVHHSLVDTDPRFKVTYAADWMLDMPTLEGVADMPLRPYQKDFVTFGASRPGVVNADDLGTGKTIQALAVIHGSKQLPVLIVGTLLARGVWCGPHSETVKWLGINVVALQTRKNAGPEIFQEPNEGWFFCHYDILEAWLPWIFNFMRPQAIIFDEAHNAGPKTKRGRAAASVARFKEIRRRIVLSATPIQNKRIDLWPILNLAAPDAFGSRHDFGLYFCGGVHGEYGWIYDDATHNSELKARLETLLMRRTKAQVLDQLPPMTRQSTEVELSEVDAVEYAKYKAAEHDIRKFLAGEGKTMAAGVTSEKLVQITKMLALLSRAKHETTASIAIEAANSTGKVVVFTWFKDSAASIAKLLKKAKIRVFGPVNGSIPVGKRIDLAQAFADHKEPAAFVATMASASESINQLAAAQELVMNDLYWKPLVMLQTEGRLHRGGQKGAVHVNYVLAKNSIDGTLIEALSRKADATETVGLVDDGKALVKTLGGVNAPIDDLDTFIAMIQEKAAKESFDFDD